MKKRTGGTAAAKPEAPSASQAALYKLIIGYFAEHGRPPTFAEIAKLDGKTVGAAVAYRIRGLNKKGLLHLHGDARTRGIEVPRVRETTKALAGEMLAATRNGGLETRERHNGKPVIVGEPPTAKQARVYKLVLKVFADNGHPPTLHELMDLGDISSTAVVLSHLNSLHRRGMIVLHRALGIKGKSRGIEIPRITEATKALASKMLAELD